MQQTLAQQPEQNKTETSGAVGLIVEKFVQGVY